MGHATLIAWGDNTSESSDLGSEQSWGLHYFSEAQPLDSEKIETCKDYYFYEDLGRSP